MPLSPDDERRVRHLVSDEVKTAKADIIERVQDMNASAVRHVERIIHTVTDELAIVKKQGALALEGLAENTEVTKRAADELVAARDERIKRAGRDEAEARIKAQRDIEELANTRRADMRKTILTVVGTIVVALIAACGGAVISQLRGPTTSPPTATSAH